MKNAVYSADVLRWLMTNRTSEGEVSRAAFSEVRGEMWGCRLETVDDPVLSVAGAMEDLGQSCYEVACAAAGVKPEPFAVYARTFEDMESRLIVMHGKRVLYSEYLTPVFDRPLVSFRGLVEEIIGQLVTGLREVGSVA